MSFLFIPGIRVKSRHLIDETSLKFVVCWIFLFYFIKKKTLWESTSKTKRLREKGACNTVLWNFIPIFSWLIDRLCRSVDCNVAVSKSQTGTSEGLIFFSIIIECNMKFTSSVEKISYKWALYGFKTLKTSQRVRNAQFSLALSVILDSVEEHTDFSSFFSTVVLLNRPRSLKVAFGN